MNDLCLSEIKKKRSLRTAALVFVSMLSPVAGWPQSNSVQRFDPALDTIASSDARLEQLPDTPGLGTREGPVWLRKGGYLVYSDRSGGPNAGSGRAESANLNKWDPRTGQVSVLVENSQSDGVALDRLGRIVLAVNIRDGKIVRIEKDGKRTVLASHYNGKPLIAPNDLVYKSDGALYFSDSGHFPRLPTDVPSLYLLKNGKLTVLSPTPAAHIESPNGLAFSLDEKHLYVTDNPKIVVFDVLPDDTISNGRLFIDLNDGVPLSSFFPDGLKVDSKGNVYCTGPGGVWITSPEGKHLGTILEPHRPANLAFGGPDGKTLFITSRPGLFQIQLKVAGIVP
jgi:gluconolactonase